MLIYGLIIYLTIVGLFSIKRKLSKKIFYINCIIVFLIITLRGYDVGSIDTINYIDWCLGIKGSMYERGEERLEYLFVSYIHFFRTFVDSGTLFLMINATLSLFPLFYIVKKKSSNPHLSLMLFFMPLTIMHRFYFVCQRQILAVGVILLGIILFEKYKKNLHKYNASHPPFQHGYYCPANKQSLHGHKECYSGSCCGTCQTRQIQKC